MYLLLKKVDFQPVMLVDWRVVEFLCSAPWVLFSKVSMWSQGLFQWLKPYRFHLSLVSSDIFVGGYPFDMGMSTQIRGEKKKNIFVVDSSALIHGNFPLIIERVVRIQSRMVRTKSLKSLSLTLLLSKTSLSLALLLSISWFSGNGVSPRRQDVCFKASGSASGSFPATKSLPKGWANIDETPPNQPYCILPLRSYGWNLRNGWLENWLASCSGWPLFRSWFLLILGRVVMFKGDIYSKLCRQGAHVLFWRHTDNACWLTSSWNSNKNIQKLKTSFDLGKIATKPPLGHPKNVVFNKGILPQCPSFRFRNHNLPTRWAPLPVYRWGYNS